MANIFIYGSGNMAWALAQAFQNAQIKISGVYGRSKKHTLFFSQHFKIPIISSLEDCTSAGDIIILAVKDDALLIINESLRIPGRQVLHTAGSVNMDIIKCISDKIGVFYPLQRVQKHQENSLRDAPICVESNNEEMLSQIYGLAKQLSTRAIKMDSQQRQKAHIAAVFVSNFSNFMFVLGHQLLVENSLPSNLFDALIKNTVDNIDLPEASSRQTGPARRGDLKTIQAHLQMLKENQSHEAIYRLLSFEILKFYSSEN